MEASLDIRVLFLCAGFGSRLAKDISNLQADHPLRRIENLPKCLLPLDEKPLLSHWLDTLSALNKDVFRANPIEGKDVFIVVNGTFRDQIIEWGNSVQSSIGLVPPSNILDTGAATNDERKGACADLASGIQHFFPPSTRTFSGLLVIAGDTLVTGEEEVQKFLRCVSVHHANHQPVLWCAWYDVDDANVHKYGILEVDGEQPCHEDSLSSALPSHGHVTRFSEKPEASSTTSRRACPCFYFVPIQLLDLPEKYVSQHYSQLSSTLSHVDATGRLLEWAVNGRHCEVWAAKADGRIDVGGLESYIKANEYIIVKSRV
ncbi:nucleotide-diphospho-sugar transferase [Gonapodya prolifera JEL478]|uniref:Nucleotide-diphospho-sugar transferase n=1 Tax=Gonapodya prolifera (strain JEL478) TaxID=1344416 RepID=A0A139A458_GONPJ|nr:nucleotide-diphospho-sugar transferase [Gonapodya prolifera JEL478]|eukprot:KXS11592.1 nucleotide-diphospho-sugar transferase [Gonapodya prolifera JEL478]